MKRSFLMTLVMALLIPMSMILASCGGVSVSLYDGDTLLKTVTVSEGKEYDLTNPAKIGYTFLGWYDSKSGGKVYSDATGKSVGMVWEKTNPTTLYARYKANKYTITFDYQNATGLNDVQSVQHTYDETIPATFPVPERTAYSFLGWFTEIGGAGTQITDEVGNFTEGASTLNADKYPITATNTGFTLYAHWGDRMVNYVFHVDGGTSVSDVRYKVGSVLYDMPSTIKEGYCFEGWAFDNTGLQLMKYPYTIPTNSSDYVQLYAKFVEGSITKLSFTRINNDREYAVSYTGNDTKIVIPDMYGGLKITEIRKFTSTTVEEVIVPQTVKTFIAEAFSGCTGLEKINIPLSVTAIPNKLFLDCEKLENVFIPNSVTTIGSEAFGGCASMTKVTLSKFVTSIGAGAFKNMSGLTEFEVATDNEYYKSIDGVLYKYTSKKLDLKQYPASKEGLTYIIPSETVKIEDYAFSSAKIFTISITNNVKSIGEGAFENCTNLVNVSINTTIAFSIDELAFSGCTNLKAVLISTTYSEIPTLANENAFTGVSDTFAVYVNSEKLIRYSGATNWRNLNNRGQIDSIGNIFENYAVEEVSGGYRIKQYFGTDSVVEIPSIINAKAVVEIGANAFSYSNMTRVYIPSSVTSIGNNAFKNCVNLKDIVVSSDTPATLGVDVFTGIHTDYTLWINTTDKVSGIETYRGATGWSSMPRIYSYSGN